MNTTRKQEIIERICSTIRRTLNIVDDNFDIHEVIRQLDGEITENIFSINEATVRKTSSNGFEIELDSLVTYSPRIRFSIAHELGHLFLHMSYMVDQQEWDKIEIGSSYNRCSSSSYSKLESEANMFAASFLMPKNRFIEIAEETSKDGFYHLDTIAEKFNVSKEAVNVRGKVIGLWE